MCLCVRVYICVYPWRQKRWCCLDFQKERERERDTTSSKALGKWSNENAVDGRKNPSTSLFLSCSLPSSDSMIIFQHLFILFPLNGSPGYVHVCTQTRRVQARQREEVTTDVTLSFRPFTSSISMHPTEDNDLDPGVDLHRLGPSSATKKNTKTAGRPSTVWSSSCNSSVCIGDSRWLSLFCVCLSICLSKFQLTCRHLMFD